MQLHTPPYITKQLTPSDTEILKKLLRVFGEAFEDTARYQNAIPSDAYLRSLLEKPHFIALAIMSGEQVVGGLAAYELEKFE